MSDPTLDRLKRSRWAILVLLAVGAVLILGRVATGFYVDLLWHRSVGYLPVFFRDLGWGLGLRVAVGVVVTLLLALNLRPVARTLGTLQIRRQFGNLEISERLPQRWITLAVLTFSAILGLWFGASVPNSIGRTLLLWTHRVEWGMVDPFLGFDLSFYVFTLPLLQAALTFALIILFLTFTMVLAGYSATGGLQLGQSGVGITATARKHLGVIGAVFLLFLAARFALGRPLLLLSGTSDVQGIFGYTDATVRLPALRIQATLAVLAAAGVLFGAWRARVVPALAGVGALIVGGILAGQVWPGVVQNFQVEPNELASETRYIEENLDFTRLGFGLQDIQRTGFEALAEGQVDWSVASAQFAGLPVWTAPTLLTTFREVDARFQYYDFPNVAFDRYPSESGGQSGEAMVGLSVREVDPGEIDDPNWQNLHLVERYVAGNGAVAVSLGERTAQGRPRTLLSGIPTEPSPDAPPSLRLEHESVFFGARQQLYAVVNGTESSYLAPDGSRGTPGVDFPDGIPAGGLLRKAALALYLGETNILLASEVLPESRLVLRRNVVERVNEIAPFLRYPEVPYPVVHEGRVTWVLEAYTASSYFPLSRPFNLTLRRPVAWARNSVKVTVDGVTGEVNFYRVDQQDPLLTAWSRSYPELFKPLDEMPEGLRSHLRYSRSLMELQSLVLIQYHQTDPEVFFGQQDQWAVPQELARTTAPVSYQAEYGIFRMPDDAEPTFQISTVFVPAGRQNLTGILAGRLGDDGLPQLRLFDIPVEEQVSGPRQVEALVEQDPAISQQFSLWRTGGSQVWTGHLHTIPVGDRVVYMEPVFLAAEEDAIPELRRFVVSDGRRVAMEETLAGAIAALAGTGPSTPPSTSPDPAAGLDPSPAGPPATGLSAEALQLLDRAEERLRAGDYAGFGQALDELRRLLRDSGGERP